MTKHDTSVQHTIDQLARRERGRLIADLVHRLGPSRLELVEDVVQEAVLAALTSWPYKGIPEQPKAWLKSAARNKAIDRLRREGREVTFDTNTHDTNDTLDPVLYDSRITDPELKLIFLTCQPTLKPIDQLLLTLKTCSGFTTREIAKIFLMQETAVAQRLARAKRQLREDGALDTNDLSQFDITRRLPSVIKTLYLMFSAGYMPGRGKKLILVDVAYEALRLALVLSNSKDTDCPETHALSALLALQASRIVAREQNDKLVLLQQQDRTLWDQKTIELGMQHLAKAKEGKSLSRYHVEAGIAAIHATAKSWQETDWKTICRLYTALEALTPSPIVQVNAAVAEAFAGNSQTALKKLESLRNHPAIKLFSPYHLARAEILLLLNDRREAGKAIQQLDMESMPETMKAHLKERLMACH